MKYSAERPYSMSSSRDQTTTLMQVKDKVFKIDQAEKLLMRGSSPIRRYCCANQTMVLEAFRNLSSILRQYS